MHVNWGVVLAVWSSSGKASSKKSEAWASEFRAVRAGATQQYVCGVTANRSLLVTGKGLTGRMGWVV